MTSTYEDQAHDLAFLGVLEVLDCVANDRASVAVANQDDLTRSF